MFDTIRRSWYLFRGSLHVLNQDRELLVFPLISGILTFGIIATFVLPIIWTVESFGEEWIDGVSETAAYSLLFVFYFISYSITYYFNAAIVSCAIYRMKGGNPDLKGGIRAASARFKEILAWALVSSTVGLILKMIQNKSNTVGKIAAGLVGVAWSVASYLVIPILVMEKKGPLDAIKASSALVKKTWGEQVAGNIGFGMFFTLILLPIFVMIPILAMTQNTVVILIMVSALVLYVALVALVQSTLTAIYQAALYLYAREDYVPEGFSRALLHDSVKVKE